MYMLSVGLSQPHGREDILNLIRRYILLHRSQGEKASPPAMHVILSGVAMEDRSSRQSSLEPQGYPCAEHKLHRRS
jgi:hypothetical protein